MKKQFFPPQLLHLSNYFLILFIIFAPFIQGMNRSNYNVTKPALDHNYEHFKNIKFSFNSTTTKNTSATNFSQGSQLQQWCITSYNISSYEAIEQLFFLKAT